MKFIEAWGDVLKQNNTLKISILALSVVTVSISIAALQFSGRDPIVIERDCFSKTVMPTSIQATAQEIESFLKEALSYRFDTTALPISEFLAEAELGARLGEQKELAQKSISQLVIVRDVKIAGNKATIDSDRLLSVGKIRSALPFNLEAELSITARSKANPYGIVLESVKEIKLSSSGDSK